MATHLLPPPERYIFEQEIKALIPNDGDITDIARYLGIKHSNVSKALNPGDSDRHNPFYLFIRYLWALDCLREGPGDQVMMIVEREREKWLGNVDMPILHPAHLTADIGKQFSEFLEAELSGKDDDAQLKELTDIEQALAKKKNEILSRFRRNQARLMVHDRFEVAATNGGRKA